MSCSWRRAASCVAKLNGEITSMIDRRTVQAAQQLVAARKATLAAQWLALQARIRDVATQPATLGAVALAGGTDGRHSRAPENVGEGECRCPGKPPPSVLGAGTRHLATPTLYARASIAS